MKDLLYNIYGLSRDRNPIGTIRVSEEYIKPYMTEHVVKVEKELAERGIIERLFDRAFDSENKKFLSERFITYDEYLDIIIDKNDYDYSLVHYRICDIDNEYKRQRFKESYKESIESYLILMKTLNTKLWNFFFW